MNQKQEYVIQPSSTEIAALLVLTGCFIVGGFAAIVSTYRSADDVEYILDRTVYEPEEALFV